MLPASPGRRSSIARSGVLSARSRAFRLAGLLLVLLAAFSDLTHASRLRAMNLEMLTRNARMVFQGRCTRVQVGNDPVIGQPVTLVTFQPGRIAKGSIHGPVTIKLLGDQSSSAPPGSETAGLPRFETGEEVILFLHEPSSLGLTSPVGFGQGKFTVVRDRQGNQRALNEPGNIHLFEGLSQSAARKLGNRIEPWRSGRAIPADLLLELVRSLDDGQAGPR